MNEKWFSLEISEIEKKLKTNAACGLTRKAARSRLRKEGRNNFFYLRHKSVSQCAKRVLADPMLILLIAVNIITAIFGTALTAIISGIMIILNLLAATFSYIKASRVAESMAEYSQPKVTILREGKLYYADSRAIVRGDIVLLGPGDIIPFDARIISCDNFSVSCYQGARAEGEDITVQKNMSSMFPENVNLTPHEYGNMVHAGSQVICGNARVVVVEIGVYTYIGALDGGIPLNDGADTPEALIKLKKISRTYSFITMAVILPLTVIGIFTFGADKLLDTFMLVMSISVSSLGELIYVIGGIIVSSGLLDLATDEKSGNVAIIKSVAVLGKIASPDYIFLLDDPALTDGSYRVCKLLIGDSEFEGKELYTQNAVRFSELLMMSEYARTRSLTSSTAEKRPLHDAIAHYGERIGIDRSLFDIRVRTAAYYPSTSENDIETAALLLHGERVSVFTSQSHRILDRCTFIRTKNGNLPLDEEIRNELKGLIAGSLSNGMPVMLCATSNAVQNGRPAMNGLTLEGIASFIKYRLPDAVKYKNALEASGIRTVIFTESENKLKIKQIMKMLAVSDKKEVVMYSDTGDNTDELVKRIDRCTVFAGFSPDRISALVKELQNKGKVVESVGLGSKYLALLEDSDVSLSFGASEYKTSGVDFSRLDTAVDSGYEHSMESAQTLRYVSDALVKRAGKDGGLGSIYNMTKTARGIHINLENALTYLLCSQTARIIISALASVLSGITLMTPSQLLFSGLLLDFGAALACAFDSYELSSDIFVAYSPKNILKRMKNSLICIAIASLASVAVALPIAIITKSDVSRAVFVSATAMQIVSFLLLRKSKSVKKLFTPISVGVCAVGSVMSIAFSLITPLALSFGASTASFVSLIIIPIAPAIFSLLHFLFFRKKTQK